MFSKLRLIKWNVRLVVLVMLVIFLLCPSVTSAYTLWGYTWDSVDPLYYYMENWVRYRTRVAFTYSMEDWNATPTPVNFQNSVNYDVYLYEANKSLVGWDGKTSAHVQGSEFVRVTCCLNMYYTDDYSTNKRRSVSGHELGHALGLWEMDWDDPVLMNQYTDWRFGFWGVFTPQQDDINGVNAMYG